MRNFKRVMIVTVMVSVTGAFAGEPVKVSGRYLQKPIPFDVPAMRGVQNVPMFFMAGEFTIRGTGIVDGVRGTVSGMGDVFNDRMVVQGVTKHEKDGDVYVNRWGGHCINAKVGDKTQTICSGDYVTLPGATGQFANMVASGTWKGVVTPEGNFDAEFDGTYVK